MYHYQKNIGDYRSATMHLSLLEHGVYNQLLDWYYLEEKPLPSDNRTLFRRLSAKSEIEQQAVIDVLEEMFAKTDEGWLHKRVEREITQYKAKAEQARAAGKLGGRPSKKGIGSPENRDGFQKEAGAKPTANREPITNTTDKSVVGVPPQAAATSALGSRLPADWKLPDPWQEWAQAERPDLDVPSVAESFRDFWIAKPGKDGRKVDWHATWRNWVRNQRQNAQPSGHHNGFKTARQQLIEGGAAAIFDGATHV